MANAKLQLMAEANRLGIEGYRKLSEADLRKAIATAKGTSAPAKGKVATNGSRPKGKVATAVKKGVSAVKGKGKTAAKSAPAKSTSQKPAAKATAAKGAQAKRPTAKAPARGKASAAQGKKAPAKGKQTAKPASSRRKPVVGRVAIDNSAIDWTIESHVGAYGKRVEVMAALRKRRGDKIKVFNDLVGNAKKYYPSKSKAEAEKMLVWLIGRVAYDYVFKTGQHEPGKRAAYGTSTAAQNIARRNQREAARKAAQKAARGAKSAGGSKGKATARKPAGKATAASKGKGKR